MILEYNYDKAVKVLEHFKNGDIAYLSIKPQVKGSEGESKFAMEYTLITDYPEPKQNLIRIALSNSLPLRLDIVSLLNKFIENQVIDNISEFYLTFNAVSVQKCEVDYRLTCKSIANDACKHTELANCLDRFDSLITKMGVADTKVESVFKKEGGNRSKKYTQLTVSEISGILRTMLSEG